MAGCRCYPSRNQGNILLKSRHKDRTNPPFWEDELEKIAGLLTRAINILLMRGDGSELRGAFSG